jgi:DNA polymerase type B, organellar and viral
MLLPQSLDNLIDDFNIETKKLLFPYKFITKENIDYIGEIPSYNDFFDKFILYKYEKYLLLSKQYDINNKWNLLEETKKYIFNDLKSLYEIIDKFGKEMFSNERINITDTTSISSLALNTFLTNYYNKKETPINIPKKKQYNEIKQGYFGGRVEIFKPYGEDLYMYDVNSLYPYIMLQDMPVGNIYRSTDTNLDNYFGFCYATVDVPKDTYNPILPYRDALGNIFNPVGKWNSMFSSELLKKAIKVNNVNVKIHYGYKFDPGKDLFKAYVNKYFSMKQKVTLENNNSKRLLSKLMLNSTYGRFGLKYQEVKSKFVSSTEAKVLSLKYKILDNIQIDKNYDIEFIKYSLEPSNILKDIDNNSYIDLISNINNKEDYINRSVPISAMITSYAACYMYDFLNIPNNQCYMTDTDSVVLKYPLDPKYVGNDLGQFKFIGKIKKGYFISPKFYHLVLDNGETITKSKGIKSYDLTEKDFIEMLYGLELRKNNIYRFKKDLTNLQINYNKTEYKLSSQILKREPTYKNNLIINTNLYVEKDEIIKPIKKKLNFDLIVYNSNKL